MRESLGPVGRETSTQSQMSFYVSYVCICGSRSGSPSREKYVHGDIIVFFLFLLLSPFPFAINKSHTGSYKVYLKPYAIRRKK